MIHNEMSFLFGAIPIPGTVPANITPIVNNNQGNTGDVFGEIDKTKYERIYKDKETGKDVIGYISDTIYAQDRISKDPYVALLDYFNGGTGSGKHGPPSMTLKAADFVYLKDLGVYPINRLIILRRYKDGVVVPNNLALFKEPPISTVIGWVKADESNKELFDFSFSEKWIEQTDTLDKVIQKIMKEQFNIKTEMFMPIPGWSQGFLFGMLNNMGLSSYDSTHVPTGDPNVLRTSMMREIEQQSLLSELKITFETSYEQKYIDGVDPGLAFQDIIANLVRCGTSDMKFVLNSDSQGFLSKFLNVVRKGGNNDDTLNAWTELGKELIKGFVNAITQFFNQVSGQVNGAYKTAADNINSGLPHDQNTTPAVGVAGANGQVTYNGQTGKNVVYTDGTDAEGYKIQKVHFVPDTNQAASESIKGQKEMEAAAGFVKNMSPLIDSLLSTVLAGSVYRYRWPLIGSIGVMSGLSTTPWHLTVGNPFSPILNMANIVVNNVGLKFSNEMGFNDMPKRVDATIDIKMSRPLGGQEINRMFNNQYGRIYTKVTSNTSKVDANSGNGTSGGMAGTSGGAGRENSDGNTVTLPNGMIVNKADIQKLQSKPDATNTNYQSSQKDLKIQQSMSDQQKAAATKILGGGK